LGLGTGDAAAIRTSGDAGNHPSETKTEMTDEEIKCQLLRVSPCCKHLEVETISWDGHIPSGNWVRFEPLPPNAGQIEINAAMERALADGQFFNRCETCKELNPLGWMHDSAICQGCAERDLGVRY
jgi:hypothetical protein